MRRGRREKGFALILALWSIALCAAAAGYGLQKSQRLSQNYAAELAIARAGMALRAGEAVARDAIWRAARAGGDPTGSRRSVFGDFNVRMLGVEGDEKMVLARQTIVTNILQHFLDQSPHRTMHQVSVINRRGHVEPYFLASATA